MRFVRAQQAQERQSLLMRANYKADELIALPVAEQDETARDARVARLLRHALEIAEHRGRDLADLTRGKPRAPRACAPSSMINAKNANA